MGGCVGGGVGAGVGALDVVFDVFAVVVAPLSIFRNWSVSSEQSSACSATRRSLASTATKKIVAVQALVIFILQKTHESIQIPDPKITLTWVEDMVS